MKTSFLANLMTRWLSKRTLMNWGVGAVLLATLGIASAGGKPYSYFFAGYPNASVTIPAPPSTPSIVLMGGGPDVDKAFLWMIDRAGVRPATGGRFVVIRATGTDAYNPYIFYSNSTQATSGKIEEDWVGGASRGLSSVETLIIPSIAAANDPFVNSVVSRANAVFIAGGDQADYINFWKGTPLHASLNLLMTNNVPIGGTSAGLAVLGQFDFAALKGTVTSTQALSDPYNRYMTLDPNPLSTDGGFLAPPALANTVLDAHLHMRDRMGRLIAFVARLVAPQPGPPALGCPGGILAAGSSNTAGARAIGVDIETALLVQGNGVYAPFTATKMSNPSAKKNAVYFVRPSNPPTQCASGKSLTMTSVEIRKLEDDDIVFNLSDWTGWPVHSFVDAMGGALTSSPY